MTHMSGGVKHNPIDGKTTSNRADTQGNMDQDRYPSLRHHGQERIVKSAECGDIAQVGAVREGAQNGWSAGRAICTIGVEDAHTLPQGERR